MQCTKATASYTKTRDLETAAMVPKDPSKRKLLTFNFTTQKQFLKSRRPRHSQRGAQESLRDSPQQVGAIEFIKICTNSKTKVKAKEILKRVPSKNTEGQKKFMKN